MFKLNTAQRKNAKLRIGMFGASGSGKTMSSLLLAHGLTGAWDKIAVLDTENNSAELYSHLGPFQHCPFSAPFSPSRYIEAIKYIESQESIEVLIIDSISHEWEGTGGCLQIHEKMGGKFQDWAKVGPLHNNFLQAILQSRLHIITCGRSKTDYALDKTSNNKTTIQKMGTKTVTREGFDYEMTIAFQINENHLATTDKDRSGLFPKDEPLTISSETGKKIKDWNNSGAVDKRQTMIDKINLLSDNDKERKDYLIDKLKPCKDNDERIALLNIFKTWDDVVKYYSVIEEKEKKRVIDEALNKVNTVDGEVTDNQPSLI